MIDGYTDVAVVVSDKEKAKKWYIEKLGFKVVLNKDHALCVSPNVDGPSLALHLCAGFVPLEPGNTGIGFTAKDFDKTCKEMKKKGVKFSVEPADNDGYKFAKFLDMDGNEYWLFDSDQAQQVRESSG